MTLRDAADYIAKLPKTEQDREHWQLAASCSMLLIMAASS